MNYRTIAPLAAYIDRVGAEELNFRRFMIKDWRGSYYTQRVLITINGDRDIVCTDDEYAPTDTERAAIKAALQAVDFPKSVHAPKAKLKDLKTILGTGEHFLYEFFDQANGNVIMVQQRMVTEDGRKFFKSWSFWSDGQWRAMEPDGALPFWKPYPALGKSRIMVHEGAKAAKAVTDMIAKVDCTHPWVDELREYEHWGMIGGALSPHRADYAELRKVNPAEVVYICDNDVQGKDALPTVSRHWRRALKGVYFDDRWPASWDMADAMPRTDEFFNGQGKYIGPRLTRLMFSATWATDIIAAGPKGGRSQTMVRQDFAEEWLHCTSPEVYVHKDHPHIIHDEKDFNNHVRPFSDVDDTARILKRSKSSKTGALEYVPYQTSGYKAGHGDGNYINTHTPSDVRPMQGDPTPWLEFMQYMVEDEFNRTELMRWVATLVARPEVKMLYGVLLISEKQGMGKGTLGEKILLPLIGKHNCSVPADNEVTDSNFNYWAAHKRLAVIHEIYAGQSSKAYNKLKSIITDRYINVNKKFQAGYEIENWLHIFACSNSLRALRLSVDDRRWFVPKITEEKRPLSYWKDLNLWLREQDGIAIIKWWANEWLKTNAPVIEGANAPMTQAKREVVEEGYSAGQRMVLNFLREASERYADKKAFMLDIELQTMISTQLYEGRQNDKLERTRTIRRVAEGAGWYVNPSYARMAGFAPRGVRAKIITNSEELAGIDPAALVARPDAERIKVAEQAQAWFERPM